MTQMAADAADMQASGRCCPSACTAHTGAPRARGCQQRRQRPKLRPWIRVASPRCSDHLSTRTARLFSTTRLLLSRRLLCCGGGRAEWAERHPCSRFVFVALRSTRRPWPGRSLGDTRRDHDTCGGAQLAPPGAPLLQTFRRRRFTTDGHASS